MPSLSRRAARRLLFPVLCSTAALLGPAAVRAGPSLEQEPQGDPRRVRWRAALASDTLRSQVWLIAPALSGASGVHVDVPLATSARWRARLGLGTRAQGPRDFSAEGSELTWSFDASELYASVERRHWGPGQTGSLILDGAAEALPAIGWRRPRARLSDNRWLQWLGPWQGDLFFGQLAGHHEPRRPYLIGMRLEAEPWPGLRLGLARTLQWGGSGRSTSLKELVRGLLGNDNFQGEDVPPYDNELGNQLAGFDWHWTLWPAHGLAWYGQIVGEDEADNLTSRNFGLSGFEARWRLPGAGRVTAFTEWTNTLAGNVTGSPRRGVTYRHHIYRQGYTHDGLMLGHPLGGDVELVSLGLRLERGGLRAALIGGRGRAMEGAQRFAPGRVEVVNAVAAIDAGGGQSLGAGAWWLRSRDRRGGSAQLWWQYAWR